MHVEVKKKIIQNRQRFTGVLSVSGYSYNILLKNVVVMMSNGGQSVSNICQKRHHNNIF